MDTIKIVDNTGKTKEALLEQALVALEAAGLRAEGYAKLELENTPRRIDTGLLRNSITHAVSGKPPAISSFRGNQKSKYDSKKDIPSGKYSGTAPNDPKEKSAVYIGSNVSYAAYVHEGFNLPSGKHVAPNRFLKNAIQKHKNEYFKIIETYLKR